MARVAEECQQLYPYSTTSFSIVYYDALDLNGTATTVTNAIAASPDQSIDILILNSGIYQIQAAIDTPIEKRREIMRVNFEAPVDLALELIQQDGWKQRGHGQLVVVASVMSKGPNSCSSTYCASKAALKNYFQTLSTEEWTWLRVNLVLPGATKTDMWEHTGTDVRPDEGTLMLPERVAELLLAAITGPYMLFYEGLDLQMHSPVLLFYGTLHSHSILLYKSYDWTSSAQSLGSLSNGRIGAFHHC